MPDLERSLACLPIYRTYVDPAGATRDATESACARRRPGDREAIDAARRARHARRGRRSPARSSAEAPAEFVTRFQQTTPAITAKGVEDTAFYRDVRLLALNEVGGDPGRFNLSVADFHARSASARRALPRTAS